MANHEKDKDTIKGQGSKPKRIERQENRATVKQGRKPTGVSFETWVERQIREAMERGEFDNLPGAGKPLPGLDKPHDESWWIKKKMREENLSYLPPSLILRKEAQDARQAALRAKSETEVRRIIAEINAKIREAIKHPTPGPPFSLMPYDPDRVVREWRRR